MIDFDHESRTSASDIEKAMATLFTVAKLSGPGAAPEQLVAAMRHGCLNGGKRLRPLLVRQAAAVFGVPAKDTVFAGMAVEMVHCYSLIHDDLPAMDDDDMRRGQPSVHKKFDEATAILAGDSLLPHAFEILANARFHPDANIRCVLIGELARGAGAGGMAGGQMRDLAGENAALTTAEIAMMQQMKTGALIRAAVRMGGVLGGASAKELAALTQYAEAAGQAFQLADDILDETATPTQMGKDTGKDASRGKATLVSHQGLEAARRQLADMVRQAISALSRFGAEADGLRASARYFAEREK